MPKPKAAAADYPPAVSAYTKRLREAEARTAAVAPVAAVDEKPKSKRHGVLTPLHPNAGVEAAYRKRLLRLVDEMAKSVVYWMGAGYRQNEPLILAEDVDPADALRRRFAELQRRWQKRFDDAAADLADYFATAMAERTDAALKAALKKAGFTIKFRPTPAQRDILKATIQANVGLIKSIPQHYLGSVEGSVFRAVQQGGDLGQLTRDLQHHHGVTRRRASFIARDQGAKATSALGRVRQLELGIERAVWRHSHGGKTPRKTHIAMNGKTYDIKEGMWDSDADRFIQPGELINCRCTSRSVIPGL